MRRLLLSVLAISSLALFSCSKSFESADETGVNGKMFTATIEKAQSKTTITSQGSVNWIAGDNILVNGVKYSVAAVGNPATTASFTKNDVQDDPQPTYHAYYPTTIINGNGKPEIPATMSYDRTDLSVFPMYAESSNKILNFRNICGILQIGISGASAKKLRISSSNCAISGEFTVTAEGVMTLTSPSDVSKTLTVDFLTVSAPHAVLTKSAPEYFYVAIPPQTYHDLKIEVSIDGTTFPYVMTTKSGDIVVSRNTIYSIDFDPATAKDLLDNSQSSVSWTSQSSSIVCNFSNTNKVYTCTSATGASDCKLATFYPGNEKYLCYKIDGTVLNMTVDVDNNKYSLYGNNGSAWTDISASNELTSLVVRNSNIVPSLTKIAYPNQTASVYTSTETLGKMLIEFTNNSHNYKVIINHTYSSSVHGYEIVGVYIDGASVSSLAGYIVNQHFNMVKLSIATTDLTNDLIIDTEANKVAWFTDGPNNTMLSFEGYPINFTLGAAGSVVWYFFSVDANKEVAFSPSNLQASIDASGNPTAWKFAPNQYTFLGEGGANRTIGSSAGDIDLFGWSTNGGDTPTSSYKSWGINASKNESDYAGDFVDWGKNSKLISALGSGWRTLSIKEWDYLFRSRLNASSKFGYATVAGVYGIILLPDLFTDPMTNGGSGAFVPEATTGWTANVYTSGGNWDAMESAGAIFLPTAGYRDGSYVANAGKYGFYWSSTVDDANYAWSVNISSDVISTSYALRYTGLSVRLVRE